MVLTVPAGPLGELVTRLHTAEDGRRWVTIDRADPVILIYTVVLDALLYLTGDHDTEWVPAWVTLALHARVLTEADPADPHLPVGEEADGTLTPLAPDYTGALLRVTAENMTAVYRVTGYAGNRTWRAVWPD
jgi:hypothetical protein